MRKIIYFDKETIKNILQEQNKGNKQTQIGTSSASEFATEIEAEAQTGIKLNVPILLRLSFLVTGRMKAKFLIKRESETTITSTEISEFDKLKPSLCEMLDVHLSDIKNSSTSFRVAGNYLRFVKGQIDDVDVKEFNAALNGIEGYDTYKVDGCKYVRFNNTAFVSNYKRNDLLTTQMTLYCIRVGKFKESSFDFVEHMNKMQDMFSDIGAEKKLADVYPSRGHSNIGQDDSNHTKGILTEIDIELFDVVYACTSS